MALTLCHCVTVVICVLGMFEMVMPAPQLTPESKKNGKVGDNNAVGNDKEKQDCEEGWTFLRETQSCYKYIDDSKDFFSARLYCKSLKGNLAMPKSKGQNAFVHKIRNANNSSNSNIWIGLNDLAKSFFVWDDNEKLNYSRWAKGAPSKQTGDNCGSMTTGAFWTDKQCQFSIKFVCQVPKNKNPANISELKPCPKGWTLANGICYKMAAKELSYNNARKVCAFEDALIAIPKSPKEQKFIIDRFIENIWIGITDRGEEGYWVAEDGRPMIYERWRNNKPPPRNKDKNCVNLAADEKWIAVACFTPRRVVCQKPAQDVGESAPQPGVGA